MSYNVTKQHQLRREQQLSESSLAEVKREQYTCYKNNVLILQMKLS